MQNIYVDNSGLTPGVDGIIHGITFRYDDNSISYTLNGQPSGQTESLYTFTIGQCSVDVSQTVKFEGCPKGGSSLFDTFAMVMESSVYPYESAGADYGDGVDCNLEAGVVYDIKIKVHRDFVMEDVVFTPRVYARASKIQQIQDNESKDYVYPITTADAVYNSSGYKLSDFMKRSPVLDFDKYGIEIPSGDGDPVVSLNDYKTPGSYYYLMRWQKVDLSSTPQEYQRVGGTFKLLVESNEQRIKQTFIFTDPSEWGRRELCFTRFNRGDNWMSWERKPTEFDVKRLINDVGNKNMIIPSSTIVPGYTETNNGVTFTVQDDYSVYVSGRATDYGAQLIYGTCNSFSEPTSFLLTGCPKNGGSATYKLLAGKSPGNYYDYGSGVVFSMAGSETADIVISVSSGTTIDDVFYPMLKPLHYGDSSYVRPSVMNNIQLTEEVNALDIAVTALQGKTVLYNANSGVAVPTTTNTNIVQLTLPAGKRWLVLGCAGFGQSSGVTSRYVRTQLVSGTASVIHNNRMCVDGNIGGGDTVTWGYYEATTDIVVAVQMYLYAGTSASNGNGRMIAIEI